MKRSTGFALFLSLVCGCHLLSQYHSSGDPTDSAPDQPQLDAGAGDRGWLDILFDFPPPDGPQLDAPAADAGGSIPGNWVSIPAGNFEMGSPANEPCREPAETSAKETQHVVTLTSDFEMQTTEVTQAQFEAVMGYDAGSVWNNPDYPQDTISWHEAAAYCNLLSEKMAFSKCYDCTGSKWKVVCNEAANYGGAKIYGCPGYRLPTEAEWEYAYRAGSGAAYYNGANVALGCATHSAADPNLDLIGWYWANSSGKPQTVGQKQPNAWGLLDMAGNVWEWCHDGYQADLGSSAATDPVMPLATNSHVIRGGSTGSAPQDARAARRESRDPTHRLGFVGARCVRSK